ncbi:MAG TPA: hypothetical protein VL020_02850 [Pseudomonadales bacterium]|nr:hypothetical protein [Pseudomonadales bacterium]
MDDKLFTQQQVEQMMNELAGEDVVPVLDPDEGYCSTCGFQATDGSNDCRCKYDSELRKSQRQSIPLIIKKYGAGK